MWLLKGVWYQFKKRESNGMYEKIQIFFYNFIFNVIVIKNIYI